MLGAICLCLGASSASAGVFQKGPYLQNVSQSSVTLMWESPSPTTGVVTLLDDSKRTFESELAEVHEVVLNDLEAGRRYRYQVEVDGERAEGEFATAPESGAPFSFVVFGDSRSNASSHLNVVERIRREVPDFILGTGDMVNEGASSLDWQKFFDIERDLLRENVLYPSLGNHDRQGRGRTADNYRNYFSLPENSPNPERYYAFTYGSARFLVLDSNAYSFALTDQTAWIEQQLQAARLDPEIVHIFVSMHHPPFSVSLHGGQAELREAWTPLFERYRVAAVFSGHDHVYTRAARNGVNYFVSGGGGAPLYPRKKSSTKIDKKATRYFERVNHYMKISVVGEHVEVTAIRADGTVMETLSWGTHPEAGELLAVGAPPEQTAPGERTPAPPQASITGQVAPPTSPFGLLGVLGALAMLGALGAIFYTLRK